MNKRSQKEKDVNFHSSVQVSVCSHEVQAVLNDK